MSNIASRLPASRSSGATIWAASLASRSEADADLALTVPHRTRRVWVRRAAAHRLDSETDQIGLDVPELRTAEVAQLLGLHAHDADVLPDDAAAHRLEYEPHQRAQAAEPIADHRVHLGLIV